jgi:hypothetical protein
MTDNALLISALHYSLQINSIAFFEKLERNLFSREYWATKSLRMDGNVLFLFNITFFKK